MSLRIMAHGVRHSLAAAAVLLALGTPVWATGAAPPRPETPRPDIGAPFDLPSSQGGRLSSVDLTGTPFALFFGYTHCPDICPTALAELSATFLELGPAGQDLRAVFITVDPARDTPDHLATYLGAFDERIVGLSGTAEETAAIARAFRAVYAKVPQADGDYLMDHTAAVYLIDRRGRFFDALDYRTSRAEQLDAFRRLLAAP